MPEFFISTPFVIAIVVISSKHGQLGSQKLFAKRATILDYAKVILICKIITEELYCAIARDFERQVGYQGCRRFWIGPFC